MKKKENEEDWGSASGLSSVMHIKGQKNKRIDTQSERRENKREYPNHPLAAFGSKPQ